MDAIPLLLLQLATEQHETRDADDEGDGAQAESQAQVSYPNRGRLEGKVHRRKKKN